MFTSRYFVQDEKRSRKQAFRWKKEHIETSQDDTITFLRAKESLAGLVAVVTAWARMRKQFISLVDGWAHYSSLLFLKCMGETHQTLSPPTVSSQSFCYKEREKFKTQDRTWVLHMRTSLHYTKLTQQFTINLSHIQLSLHPLTANSLLYGHFFFVPEDSPYIDSCLNLSTTATATKAPPELPK